MWWLVIAGVITIIVSTLALWAWLPEPMAVQWAWSGEPNNSMPKLAYMLLWSGAWGLVASYLVWLGPALDIRRLVTTFAAGVLFAGHVTTLENNVGADSWQAAERLDFAPALVLTILGTALVSLVTGRLQT